MRRSVRRSALGEVVRHGAQEADHALGAVHHQVGAVGQFGDLVAAAAHQDAGQALGPEFLDRASAPILNVHPALLPAFRGLNAQRQAIEAGVRVTGATVHFVDSGMDTGPILLQAPLEVLPGDTEKTLSERLLPLEHRLYVEAIRLIQRGAVHREGHRVTIDPGQSKNPPAAAGADRRK